MPLTRTAAELPSLVINTFVFSLSSSPPFRYFFWGSAMNIYVGNLSFGVSETDLESAFADFGYVESAKVIKDRDSGRSRGFGFVEMGNRQEGEAAVKGMNLQELDGRCITVNEAKPRQENSRRW